MKHIEKKLKSIIARHPFSPFTKENPHNTYELEIMRSTYSLPWQAEEELISALEKNESIKRVFDNKWITLGNSGHTIQLNSLAKWLITECNDQTPNEALKKLSSFISDNICKYQLIVGISGITISKPFLIDDDSRLIAFNDLPNSLSKELMSPPYLQPRFLRQNLLMPLDSSLCNYHLPEVALIQDKQIHPATSDKPTRIEKDAFKKLYNICSLLTVVCEAAPTVVGCWSEIDESVPGKHYMGSGHSRPMNDSMPTSNVGLDESILDDFIILNKKYEQLNDETKHLLQIPLQRLNLSRKRSSLIDKVIELGIAMESLLLNDKIYLEKITTTFINRGKDLAHSEDLSKTKAKQLFNKIYYLRSQAMHKGSVDEEITIKSDKYSLSEFISLTDSLCADLIKKVISQGGFPWPIAAAN